MDALQPVEMNPQLMRVI